ncbi:melanophilin-like isoform X2 [Erpetoichthys calabaricus]|uniref:melanophilin-like isoform X2 n=1 Tax=Erpetoichthys calabaricus TaxID=27687 RepID=UPI00109EF4BB|nr:melanophilin-like isoform X2 [Erpetoichthys calabaricus]
MDERSAQVQGSRLAAMGKKLDLSKLTDEEAKHIWQVIQRDFDLRKKEDDRLGQLKSQIKKEDVKRELLGEQTSLTNSYCIRCLQPFRFLVNSKCQCRDCGLYTCKACSRYHKKERGWVCDPCRLSRVVKMGTLDWYHEHVRSRFKRFGSAKVMRSLYRRQHGSGQSLHPEFFALQDEDTLSMPENHGFDLCDAAEGGDGVIDASEAQHYKMMRKKRRLLSVHPLDFDLDSEYSAQSRRESFQYTSGLDAVTPKEPVIAEADITSMFQQILEEQRQQGEEEPTTELQLHASYQNSPASLMSRPLHSHYSGDLDTSDEEPEARFPVYQSHFHQRRSRESPPEGVESTPQISELNKRMSAIERLLTRLERKIAVPSEKDLIQGAQSDADLEENKLKWKLNELAGNISDKGLTSDEEDAGNGLMTMSLPNASKVKQIPCGVKDTVQPTQRPSPPSQDQRPGNEADETRQQLDAHVSDIESRIAALHAAGMSVSTREESRKETLKQTSAGEEVMPKALFKAVRDQCKTNTFDRNDVYRGSLTQRNPSSRTKRSPIYAKPVMAHHA